MSLISLHFSGQEKCVRISSRPASPMVARKLAVISQILHCRSDIAHNLVFGVSGHFNAGFIAHDRTGTSEVEADQLAVWRPLPRDTPIRRNHADLDEQGHDIEPVFQMRLRATSSPQNLTRSGNILFSATCRRLDSSGPPPTIHNSASAISAVARAMIASPAPFQPSRPADKHKADGGIVRRRQISEAGNVLRVQGDGWPNLNVASSQTLKSALWLLASSHKPARYGAQSGGQMDPARQPNARCREAALQIDRAIRSRPAMLSASILPPPTGPQINGIGSNERKDGVQYLANV